MTLRPSHARPRLLGRAIRVPVLALSLALSLAVGLRAAPPSPRLPWSFAPLAPPAVPDVAGREWPRSPLDRFILQALEARGLAPAAEAARATLQRRVTFDLTGLPPTPDEVADFLADDAPDALERAADRLLASPRHGERWGRHWLDVARYADSNGMDENLAYGSAYRYRDYVIAAFNADKPFDELVVEQIAGDLLGGAPGAPETNDRVVATGFLTLGPKMLAEDDPVKMEMDIIDEQVEAVGKAFLGMTLGCARCHDHKYDPVSMEDYYGLAGIFKSTRTMDNFKVVARWHERPIATPEELARRRAADESLAAKRAEREARAREAHEELVAAVRERRADYAELGAILERRQRALESLMPAATGDQPPAGALLIEAESFARGNVVRDFTTYGNPIGVIYNAGTLPNVAEYDLDVPAAGAYQIDLRYAAAEARPVRLLVGGAPLRSDAARGATGSWTPESQRWEAQGVARLAAGKATLRLERDGPFPHVDKILISPVPEGQLDGAALAQGPAELAGTRELNAAVLEAVAGRLRASPPVGGAEAAALVDGFLADPAGPFSSPAKAEPLLPPRRRAAIETLRAEEQALEKALPVLPEAMAVEEGTPTDLRVHLRGSHLDLGAAVPRRLPLALAGAMPLARPTEMPTATPTGTPTATPTAMPAAQSGRLELARWIASAGNPLTARVIANRVWRWRFGRGLVRTADNFGNLGERPTHPGLLDWLAIRLLERGGSLKALHRELILSATYRQGAAHDARAAAIDPENTLRWRWSRRRLEAEAVRDALLFSSGGLDLAMGGPTLQTRDREYVATTVSTNATRYDLRRRSVYLPVVRSALFEALQAFDFADPSCPNGDRDTSTVAPQSLFLLNSAVVAEAGALLARRGATEAGPDDAMRIQRIHELALSRPAAPVEVAEALDFIRRHAAAQDPAAAQGPGVEAARRREEAWIAYCRCLLATSEVTHVD